MSGRGAHRGLLAALVLRILGRFLAGHHLDGKRRSDATFWRDGTQGLEGGGWFGRSRESWWVLAAGWRRLAVRLIVAAVVAGLALRRDATVWVLALAGGPVLGLLAWRRIAAIQVWRHTRELVRPLALALSAYLGIAPRAVEAALEVRPDFEDADGGEHVGALALPDHWAATPDQQATVEQIVGARFGMELRYQWRTHEYPMVLNLTRAPVPPAVVPFAEQLDLMGACSLTQVLLGIAADGRPRYWDTSLEDPHMAIHGGSRRGKTSLLLLIAAQELAKQAERVTWINPKITGHEPVAGLPGVRVHADPRDVTAMWDAIKEFHQLIEDRYKALAADPTIQFDRALLIIDELSQFSSMTTAYWRAERSGGDPARCPYWDEHLGPCVWMGAQCRAHVIVAGQRLDYAVLGGMLGSFGVRLLAGFQPQDFKRLVGTSPIPRSQKPRGRFLLSEGGDLEWLQLVRPDEDGDWTALRDFAAEVSRPAAQARQVPGQAPADLGATARTQTPDTALIVGLDAAARHLGMKPSAFEKARQRRAVVGETTTPDGRPAWTPQVLTAWREARPSAQLAVVGNDSERAS